MSGGKSAGDKAPHRVDGGGKSYLKKPHVLLGSEAHRQLSFRARAALDLLLMQFNGYNNAGPATKQRLSISARQLAYGLNSQNHPANKLAMRELVDHGFIEITRDYPKSSRLAREYRLTFVSSGPHATPSEATNEYLKWQPQQRKKGKNRVDPASTETSLSVEDASTEGKDTVDPASTHRLRFPQKPVRSSVDPASTHIANHDRGSLGSSGKALETSGGIFSSEPIRPASMDEASWTLARRQTQGLPSIPSTDELRERVLAHVGAHPRGAQGRLARTANIPEGTFSKFLKTSGPLSDQARVALTCALPRCRTIEAGPLPRMTARAA